MRAVLFIRLNDEEIKEPCLWIEDLRSTLNAFVCLAQIRVARRSNMSSYYASSFSAVGTRERCVKFVLLDSYDNYWDCVLAT